MEPQNLFFVSQILAQIHLLRSGFPPPESRKVCVRTLMAPIQYCSCHLLDNEWMRGQCEELQGSARNVINAAYLWKNCMIDSRFLVLLLCIFLFSSTGRNHCGIKVKKEQHDSTDNVLGSENRFKSEEIFLKVNEWVCSSHKSTRARRPRLRR